MDPKKNDGPNLNVKLSSKQDFNNEGGYTENLNESIDFNTKLSNLWVFIKVRLDWQKVTYLN